jgi:crotonobetainyl-CoA:carnitine CoA-transferase CaiB-like acyl-CoA transferase
MASVETGMGAVQAILAMLYRRERDGGGDYCHISLLGQLLSLKQLLMAAQSNPDRWEGFHLNGPHWPADTGWQTSDGQVTFDFRHGEREGWVKFCEAVGLADLPNDPEYADWRSTIYIGDRKSTHGTVYHPVFRRMTSQEASDLINGLGGISVKFHDYAEVLAHPQLRHLSPTVSVPGAPQGADQQVGTPFQFEGAVVANPSPHPAPALDADRAAIMQSIRPHLQVTR